MKTIMQLRTSVEEGESIRCEDPCCHSTCTPALQVSLYPNCKQPDAEQHLHLVVKQAQEVHFRL